MHALAVNDDEHQPQENNRENDQDVDPNDRTDDSTEHCLSLKFWEVHIIKKCKIVFGAWFVHNE